MEVLEIEINQFVKDKEKNIFGTTHYSTFGLSIHFYDVERGMLTKIPGTKVDVLTLYWETYLDGKTMPDGYEWNDEYDRLYIKPKQKG